MNLTDLQSEFSDSNWPKIVSITKVETAVGKESGSKESRVKESGLNQSQDQQTYLIQLRIVPEIRWFTGHFPGQPVLPGVVQTHWAGSLSRFLFNLPDTFTQIHNLKFQTMILPNAEVALQLQFVPDKNSVRFSFFNVSNEFSSGRLEFAA